MTTRYVTITPVRNEGYHLQQTIDSMLSQTVRPRKWVIVNDGSTDHTGLLIDKIARSHPWIEPVHRADRGFRQAGGGVIEAFYDGYRLVEGGDWEYLVKLDGDLSFDSGYFARCFERFAEDPRLGIGGGRVYCRVNGRVVEDSPHDPEFHVRGATKIYRRETWEAIGGLIQAPGWDTLDELKANMHGWKTYSFHELQVLQLKATGAADGSWKNWFKNGRANYMVGYHPLFMICKCVRRFIRKPIGVEAAALLCGYFSGYFSRVPRVADTRLIQYVRRQQMARLLFRPSLWPG